MAFATKCACGSLTESLGGLCDRCVALQALGLDKDASDGQIENAYRMLVRVWHPDRFQDDPKLQLAAEEKLKEINSAHEFLVSGEAVPPPAMATRARPEREAEPIRDSTSTEEDGAPEAEADLDSPEIRRVLQQLQQRKSPVSKHLRQAGFTLASIAIIAMLWFVTDAILMSNPKTAGPWEQQKTEVLRDLRASGLKLWGNAKGNVQPSKEDAESVTAPRETPPSLPQQSSSTRPIPATTVTGSSTRVGGPPHIKVGDSPQSLKPYVTSGLTAMEVLSILGNPTSSSGEKMFYKGSEIDFRDGHVVGWSVDQKTPIRVKLWPDRALVQGVTQFALGSPKSDVIALQGTPTLFSDNKFGYGNSVVYFQNNRVSAWNEDPNSVRLRVAH